MYEKQSLPGKAAGEYARAAEGHLKKKETEKAEELLAKALQISPQHRGARLGAAELYAGREEWDKIVEVLEPLASGEAADAQVLKTFAGACLKTGRPADAIGALEKARETEPSSLPVKTLLGRAYLQGDEFDKALEIYSPMISDDLKENRIEAAEDLARELVQASPENDRAQQRLLEVLQKKGDTEEVPGIYLKLSEIYQARGLAKNAAGVLEKYLELKPEDKEVAARLGALASGGAPPAPAPAEEAPPAVPPSPAADEIDVEMIDLEGEDLAEMVSAEKEEAAAPPPADFPEEEVHIEAEDEEEEIVLDFEDELEGTEVGEAAPEVTAQVEVPAAAAGEVGEGEGEEKASLDDEAFMALDLETAAEEPDIAGEAIPQEAREAEPVREETAAEEIVEEVDLEEVDLEETGLAASAEPVSAPEPEVEVRAEAVSQETAVEAEPELELAEPSLTAAESGGDLDFDLSDFQEADEAPSPVMEAGAAPATGLGEELEEFLAEADFYFQQGLLDEAEFLYEKLSKLAPDSEEIAERLAKFREEKAAAEAPKAAEGPILSDDGISSLESDLDRALREPEPPPPGLKITIGDDSGETRAEEFSDFLSDLREELKESVPPPQEAPVDDEGMSEIFQEFREGLKEQLGGEDFETHYNLGIAYKEMGLLQEALGEFELSEKSESRRLDSMSMMALCLVDMGKDDEAVSKLQEGLHLASEGSEEQKGFLYDLGDLYGRIGHQGESMELFDRLHQVDPSYRDVSQRLGRQEQEVEGFLPLGGERLELPGILQSQGAPLFQRSRRALLLQQRPARRGNAQAHACRQVECGARPSRGRHRGREDDSGATDARRARREGVRIRSPCRCSLLHHPRMAAEEDRPAAGSETVAGRKG
jgi:tetratricopeptide (TPR) repeat protein